MGFETVALMTAISAAASVAGGAAAAAGALQAGAAGKAAGDYNATVAAQRAASERDAAAAEAQDFTRAGEAKVASGLATTGAGGVLTTGSPLMVDEATVREVALGAARKLQGGEVRATRLEQEGELARMQGNAAETAGYLGAGKSLLTGIGAAAGGYGKGSGRGLGPSD